MTRLMLAVCLIVACRASSVGPGQGAATPAAAVEQLLAAARAQDLQAISAIWGDERGLVRDREARQEVESRTFIMACILRNDKATLGEIMPAAGGRMIVSADLTQGTRTGNTRFETARTAAGRWLVSNMDLPALQNRGFCARSAP
jgi:hypothetical protein